MNDLTAVCILSLNFPDKRCYQAVTHRCGKSIISKKEVQFQAICVIYAVLPQKNHVNGILICLDKKLAVWLQEKERRNSISALYKNSSISSRKESVTQVHLDLSYDTSF